MIQKIVLALLLSGALAVAPNFLWMLGILPHPENSVMDARWFYAFVVGLISFPTIANGGV